MDILSVVRRELAGSVFSIGTSVCGNPILCSHRGSTSGKQLIITAGIHARECYTALCVLRQAREHTGGGAYFIPLVDPDGAIFFETGETFGRPMLIKHRSRRLEWKANADGVDLNTNFDANWGTGVSNVRTPGPSDYIGSAPLCAPESAALAAFTVSVRPAATVSYHCMGGELYWEFYQTGEARCRDGAIAAAVARHIGVKKVDGALGSAGGYKDWCVKSLGIPAVTIELIKRGRHPFGKDAYAADIDANADLPAYIHSLL